MGGFPPRFRAFPAVALAVTGTLLLAFVLTSLHALARPGDLMVALLSSFPSWTQPMGLLHRASWLMAAQGTSAALAVLAATWVVWGPGRLTTRIAVSACWVTVILLLWQALLPTVPRWFGTRNEQQLLVLGTWVGAIGLCAAARRFGIRIIDPADHPLASDPRSRQMSLLGLLAIMSGAAVLLGILRQVVPQGGIDWAPTGDDIFRLLVQIAASLLVASTVITCFHVPRPLWLNLLLVCGFVSVIAVLHLVAYGQTYGMYLFPPDLRLKVRAYHYVWLTIWLLTAVALLRTCGMRLRQFRQAGSIPRPDRVLAPMRAGTD